MDGQELDIWQAKYLYLLQTACDAGPVSYSVGTAGSPSGIKRPGCEDNHSPPDRPEVESKFYIILHPEVLFLYAQDTSIGSCPEPD